MCFICDATQVFAPGRHVLSGISKLSTSREILDATVAIGTEYDINLGGSSDEENFTRDDPDLMVIGFNLWQPVTINLVTGFVSGVALQGSDGDGQIIIRKSGANTISEQSELFTTSIANPGRHTVPVTSRSKAPSNDYSASAENESGASQSPTGGDYGTLDELSNFLTTGYWNSTGRSWRKFPTSVENEISVNLSGLTEAGQKLARWAFEAWERVTNLIFVETNSSEADIVIDDEESGAYAFVRTSGNTILSSEINISQNWLASYGSSINSYSFQTYLHEIGHALGLGHQGAYNGNAIFGVDQSFENDSWQISVMSYFSQSENHNSTASRAYAVTPMMSDIIAIQDLYGKPDTLSSQTAGKTTWGVGFRDSYMAEIFSAVNRGTSNNIAANVNFSFTIYDVGGEDTIDLGGSTSNDRIDINAGSFSDVFELFGNLAIAPETLIENVIGGFGSDTITGNSADNYIRGGDGMDVINGGGGRDTLNGEGGNDTLTGGADVDVFVMEKGGGDDVLTDFTEGVDIIHFKNENVFFSLLDFKVESDGVRIHVDESDSVMLLDVFSNEIEKENFKFNSFNELNYIASHPDLILAFGSDSYAGASHFLRFGGHEGRGATFDSLDYIASYSDLIESFGQDEVKGARHYIDHGYHEGRVVSFEGLSYIASHIDLISAFFTDEDSGTRHYIEYGHREGRQFSFEAFSYIASYEDLIVALGANKDLGAKHFIEHGRPEEREIAFDGLSYIASNADLISAIGANKESGSRHYIEFGRSEGRSASFNAEVYLSNYSDLQREFGGDLDSAKVHYIQYGYWEGRTDDLLFF